MSIIKYGFNRQLAILCQSLCYRAFGVHLNSTHHPSLSTNNILNIGYQSDIAGQLYQYYRQDGFKYAEPGITPKAIAEQIQVHMKKCGDLDWIIDQFGRFVFLPTQTYLQNITTTLLTTNHYTHNLLSQIPPQITKSIKKQTHYFDYYISNKVTVSQLRKLIRMEYQARILEKINGHNVVRTVFSDYVGKLGEVERVVNMLFGQMCGIQPVEKLVNSCRELQKGRDYQYLNCNREDTIPIQKQFPNHILLNTYLGNQPTPIQTLTPINLKQTLSQPPRNLIKPKQPILQNYKQKLTTGEIIVMYGNLLDNFQFQYIQRLFGEVKGWEIGRKEEIRILEMGYLGLLEVSFQ